MARDPARCAGSEVAMIRIYAPHRGEQTLWLLKLPFESTVLQRPQ
jgi:hypothetical protein